MKQKMLTLDGSEQSMIPIIKDNAKKLPFSNAKNVITLEEFSAGTGISDLTIFTVDDRLLQQRKRSNKSPLTSRSQIEVLLSLLESDGLSLDQLIAKTSIKSRKTIKVIIEQLVEAKLAIKKDTAYVASYDIAHATTDNIIAIEAKVRDWKSGVRQAMRYKEYADYSYVAIYEKNVSSCLSNIGIFEQLGIGLIGVDDSGIKVHLEARLSDVKTPENRLLAYERFISAIDKRYETFVAGNGFVTNNAR